MGKKQHRVKLQPDERTELAALVSKGKAAKWKLTRARALLKCDESEAGPAWCDQLIAEAYGVTTRSIENWRKQAVFQGPLSLLFRKPPSKPPNPPKFDGEKEARLVALACSTPPSGYARWSLRLLAEQAVVLEIVETVSHETVRQVLKKTN